MTFLELIFVVIVASAVVTIIALLLGRKSVPGISRDEDVIRLLDRGEELKAIKAYRQLHRVSLKRAKEFVESQRQQGRKGS